MLYAMFICLVLLKTMGKGDRYTIMVHKAVLECTHAIEQTGNVKTVLAGRNAGRNAQFSRWLVRTKQD